MDVYCFTGRYNEHRIHGYSLTFAEMLVLWPALKPENPMRFTFEKDCSFYVIFTSHSS